MPRQVAGRAGGFDRLQALAPVTLERIGNYPRRRRPHEVVAAVFLPQDPRLPDRRRQHPVHRIVRDLRGGFGEPHIEVVLANERDPPDGLVRG